MRKTLKSNNGMTLVALVITIGVLLILAVVTITQVLDDEGIVNKSSEFAENTTESMNQTGEELDNALTGLDDIMNPWKQNKTEITKTLKSGTIKKEVGDDYEYSCAGYTGGWKILGVENGKLLIMSTEDIGTLELSGKDGYYNGINKMEEMCTKFGDNARSVKIEDIDRVTGYDPLNQGDGTKWGNGQFWEYGNEVTYIPTGCTAANGQTYTGPFRDNKYVHIDGREIGKNNVTEIKLKQTAYEYYPYSLTQNSGTTGECKGISTSSKAYKMIFGESTVNQYWLASSYTSTSYAHSYWGFFTIGKDAIRQVNCEAVYCSNDTTYTLEHGVRVVISIQ